MITIKIVINSDRCHCSVDNVPIATFLYSNYKGDDDSQKAHAINDSKVQCFNELNRFRKDGIEAMIDTLMVNK